VRLNLKLYILFCLSVAFFSACENDLSEVNRLTGSAEKSIEIITDVEILYSDSARMKVRITGDTLIRYLTTPNGRDVFPHGVKFEFYNDSGQVSSTLTAKKAERLMKKQQVICSDSVLLKSVNGEEIFTNELIWDEPKKIVFTEKFVRLSKPNEVIYSYGFRSNQDFTRYEIKAVSGKLDGGKLKEGF